MEESALHSLMPPQCPELWQCLKSAEFVLSNHCRHWRQIILMKTARRVLFLPRLVKQFQFLEIQLDEQVRKTARKAGYAPKDGCGAVSPSKRPHVQHQIHQKQVPVKVDDTVCNFASDWGLLRRCGKGSEQCKGNRVI